MMIIEFENKDGGKVALDTYYIAAIIPEYGPWSESNQKFTGHYYVMGLDPGNYVIVNEETRNYVLKMWKDPV